MCVCGKNTGSCCPTTFNGVVGSCPETITFLTNLVPEALYDFEVTDRFGNVYLIPFASNEDGSATLNVSELPEGLCVTGQDLDVRIKERDSCAYVPFALARNYDKISVDFRNGASDTVGCVYSFNTEGGGLVNLQLLDPEWDEDTNTLTISITDNLGVVQSKDTQIPLSIVSLSDAERIDNSNGQWMEFIDNAGVTHSVEILEPYEVVPIDDLLADFVVDNDMVGRLVLWQGNGWYQLFDSDPSGDYNYVIPSNYDSNYWWAEVSFRNDLSLRWKIASGTHSNNTIPKVTNIGELGSSNISDSGTIVTIGGNGLTIPNTTTTGATTNGLIKYNTTANEYRGVRSGVELKFLQTGDVTMSRFVWVNSATGTDTRTGLSVYSGDRPFATLQAAVTACASGDTIVVMNSTLTENVTIFQSKGNTLKVYLISTTFTGNIENIRSIECMQGTTFNGRPLFNGAFVNPIFQGDKTCTWNIPSSSLLWAGTSRCYIRGFGTISNLSSSTARFIANSGTAFVPADFNKDVNLVIEDIALLSVQNLGTLSTGVLFRNIDKITVSGTRAIDTGSNSRAYFKNCYNIECAGRFILSAADANNYYAYFDDCNVRGSAGNLFDTSLSGALGGLILKAKSTNFYATGDYVVSSNVGYAGLFIQLNFCTLGCASATHAINFTASGYPSLSITSCYGNPTASHNLAPTAVYTDYVQVTNLQTNQIWN